MADEPGSGAGLQGSFVMQKTGPLPNWVWMLLGLGVALGIAYWKSAKAKKENPDAAATGPNGVNRGKTGSAADDYYVFVDADSTVNTQYAAPPGGGRGRPGGPRPDPSPAPDGEMVSVTQWNKKNAPWNSTIYGIAEKLWGNGNAWKQIWYAPQNTRLRELRSTGQYEDKGWENIQPGDKVWVPTAPAGSGADNHSGRPGGRDEWDGDRGHDQHGDDQHGGRGDKPSGRGDDRGGRGGRGGRGDARTRSNSHR